jgi:uncharacterized membrane protein (UPF0127 family)
MQTLKTSALMKTPPGIDGRRIASTGKRKHLPIQASPRRRRRALCLGVATLLLAGTALPACRQRPQVIIRSAHGPVTVTVEIANAPATRARGLMYRTDLEPDAGKLFIFPQPHELRFWMKNTPLPLDMIFINDARTVVGIVANARPFSTQGLGVNGASKYVLEVHGGFCARRGIAAGDVVEFVRIDDRAT